MTRHTVRIPLPTPFLQQSRSGDEHPLDRLDRIRAQAPLLMGRV